MTEAGSADNNSAGAELPGDHRLFEVVGTEVVFPGKIVTVRVDQVAMPGGGVARREVVGHHQAAAIVALDDQRRVLLIGQYRHPLGRRLWELPAGLLDVAGEDARQTAARELAEEAGLAAADWQLLVEMTPSPGIIDERIRVFLARDLTSIGRQGDIADEEADLTMAWVPLETAVAAVFRGDIVNAAAVAGLLAAHVALTEQRELRPGDVPWDRGPARIRTADEPLEPVPAL